MTGRSVGWAEEVYRVCLPRVRDYVVRRCEPSAVDDVVAEVFMAMWRRRDDIAGDPLPWLLGSARRVMSTHRRGEDRRGALRLRVASMSGAVAYPDAADSVVDAAALRAALLSLSDDDQEVLALIAWDELPVSAAAEVMCCTPAALRMRLSRARHRLERALGQAGSSTGESGHPATTTKDSA